MPARYHFITTIELEATPDRVWEVLSKSESWTEWWPWLEEAELIHDGDSQGLGRTVRHLISSPTGYRLGYVGIAIRVREPEFLEFTSLGALEGTGLFQLEMVDNGSRIVFTWLVETPRRWMNMLAPLARPIFSWNHDRLMDAFARGLAQATGTSLKTVFNQQQSPGAERFFALPE